MDKNIRATVIGRDKAISAICVEEFDPPSWHAHEIRFNAQQAPRSAPKESNGGGSGWPQRAALGCILGPDLLGAAMKVALQSTLILVLWIVFWLGGTIGGAVLQARLIDIGVVSDIDPPWIITIGSSFIGFFAGAYAAVKLGDLTLRKK